MAYCTSQTAKYVQSTKETKIQKLQWVDISKTETKMEPEFDEAKPNWLLHIPILYHEN